MILLHGIDSFTSFNGYHLLFYGYHLLFYGYHLLFYGYQLVSVKSQW